MSVELYVLEKYKLNCFEDYSRFINKFYVYIIIICTTINIKKLYIHLHGTNILKTKCN